MSLFGSRFPAGGDFAPLFRLLDDYSAHANSGYSSRSVRSFQPRFDVREVNNSYELQGELPGIDQRDIHIEFTDPTTLVIKGRTERERTSGTPPAAAVEGNQPVAGQIANEESSTSETAQPDNNYHKASVEDEASEGAATTSDASTSAVNTPTASSTTETGDAATTTAPAQKTKSKKRHHNDNGSHYWVSERSVGEFHRSFSFPSRIDQEAVKASLKNGILSVVVPKAAAHQSRRIAVE